MDLSLRDWLVIFGILVIAVIIFDGWRRVRGGRSRLKMKIDRNAIPDADEDIPDTHSGFNPELPNGGARVIGDQAATASQPAQAREEPSFDLGFSAQDTREPQAAPAAATVEQPEGDAHLQAELPLAEPVPSAQQADTDWENLELDANTRVQPLAEAEASQPAGTQPFTPAHQEQDTPDPLFDEIPLPEELAPQPEEEGLPEQEDSLAQSDLDLSQPVSVLVDEDVEMAEQARMASTQPAEPEVAHTQQLHTEPDAEAVNAAAGHSHTRSPGRSRPQPEPEYVLLSYAVALESPGFNGALLEQIITACGMEFDPQMGIYNRFESTQEDAQVQFSMANATADGRFDLETIGDSYIRGVSFFMAMNEPEDPLTALECMLATAETLTKHLKGELLDEDRSVMRPQTKEHYRQRIRDFEMDAMRRQRVQ